MYTSELGGHGQEFGQELVSESVPEADSDTPSELDRDSDTRVRQTLVHLLKDTVGNSY